MRELPRDSAFDNSLAFLREGYRFVFNRSQRLNTDIFQTRIMLTPVICMRGADAAEVFYGRGAFTRVGAMPRTALHLLQDRGSVQMLDGDEHRNRKQMFMTMMLPDSIERITVIFAEEWMAALSRGQAKGSRRPA